MLIDTVWQTVTGVGWVCYVKKYPEKHSTWNRQQRHHITAITLFQRKVNRVHKSVWPYPTWLTSTRCEDRICRCVCALIIWNTEKSDIWGIWQNHKTVQMPFFSFPLRLTADCVCVRVCFLLPFYVYTRKYKTRLLPELIRGTFTEYTCNSTTWQQDWGHRL